MPYKILSKLHITTFSPFIVYAVAVLFIGLGDAILSYIVPIYLENNLGDTSKMGIIIAFSSAAGVLFDILLGKSKIRSSRKFFIWAFLSAMLFPISIAFFPPIVPIFIAQMVIWGLYYELIAFSNYSFINEYANMHEHASSWGILSVFRSIAYAIGPIIAGITVDISLNASTGVSAGLFIIGILIFALFLRDGHKRPNFVNFENKLKEDESFGFELRAWWILLKKIWPIYLFSFLMTFVDSGFWTIGVLFSEELQKLHAWGEWFLVIYMLPATFMGFFAAKFAQPFGKKRIAMICGVFSGLLMFLLLFTQNVPLILILVFLSSAFTSLSSPEISAAFEDYIHRLGGYADDMIGLQQTSGSFAYVLGPIILGFLSAWYGNRVTFSILGFILMTVSLICMVFTPKKIHMPHLMLDNINKKL